MTVDTTLITAAAAFLLGVFSWLSDRKTQRAHDAWCAAAAKAEGVVSRVALRGHLSRNEPTDSDEGSTVPVVRFKAANGVEYEFDAPDVSMKVGTPVAVAYDPALPSSARTVARTPRIGCAVILVIGALVLAGRALYLADP